MLNINGQAFGNEYFGNNEAIYKDADLNDAENTITLKFEDNRDIANLVMAVEYIRDEKKDCNINLEIPYLPYSGMDRKINNQVFSLKIFAQVLNKLNFSRVTVLDLHNEEVADKLINNIEHSNINYYIGRAIDDFKPDVLYFPDKGAMAKYPHIVDTHGLPVIHGNKVRDLNNKGKIISYETVTDGVDIEGKRILVIDDICRKGGTFTWAASELKKLGVSDIALYISHCETGIFDGNVLDNESPVTKVYTNDSEPGFIKLMDKEGNIEKSKKICLLE